MIAGRKIVAAVLGAVGVGVAVVLTAGYFIRKDRAIKDIPFDPSAKTGHKAVDAILGKLHAASVSSGIPLGLMVGWVVEESGGRLADTTDLDERGYFQLMPDESKQLGLDHQRLSTDSDYSIDAGVKLIRHYQSVINNLMAGVTSAGTSYYWRLVKLAHSMGSGQIKKVINAAKDAEQTSSWDQLEQFAKGMRINGPQPKKWFPFVDLVYKIGQPFGFGSEASSLVGLAVRRDYPGQKMVDYLSHSGPVCYVVGSGLDSFGAEDVDA